MEAHAATNGKSVTLSFGETGRLDFNTYMVVDDLREFWPRASPKVRSANSRPRETALAHGFQDLVVHPPR